jgi:hypothetical protein
VRALGQNLDLVAATGAARFAISGMHGRQTDNFESFGDFEAAVNSALTGGTPALRITADGEFDAAGDVFTARRITLLLSN